VVVSAERRVRRRQPRAPAASTEDSSDRERTEDWNLDGYSELLRTLVKPLSGRSSRKITLRVRVADVSVDEVNPHRTTATVSVVATDDTGRGLASTSSTTTLIGNVRYGMIPSNDYDIDAAVIDAFQRGVVSNAFIGQVNEGLACVECPPAAPMVHSVNAWAISGDEQTAAAHVVGVAFDAGRAYSLGARYQRGASRVGPRTPKDDLVRIILRYVADT
jgi:hypothetical protein